MTRVLQKIERLRSSLHGLSGKSQNQHAIFVDTPEEVKAFDAANFFDTAPELVDRVRVLCFLATKLSSIKNDHVMCVDF